MTADVLAIYLNDHLAGSVAALELIDTLAEQVSGQPLAQTLRGLRREVSADQETLRELIGRLDAGESNVKRAAAWLSEKAGRVKLALAAREHPALARLEGLEALAMGIQGKRGLWRALAQVAEQDARLEGPSYGELEVRAVAQHEIVERERLAAAREALAAGEGSRR